MWYIPSARLFESNTQQEIRRSHGQGIMKKTLIAASSLIVAGVLIAPGIVGGQVKSRLDNFIVQLNQVPEIEISWESYNKSWFGADGVLNTRFTMPLEPGIEPLVVDIQSDITVNHGPVILKDGLKLAWASWKGHVDAPESLKQAINQDIASIFEQDGQINLLGNISMKEYVPAFVFEDDVVKVDFSGYESESVIRGDHLEYQGGTNKIIASFDGYPEDIEVHQFGLALDSKLPAAEFQYGALYPGKFILKAGGIYAGQELLMDDFTTTVDLALKENDTLADITTSYSASRVQTQDIMLTNAGFDMTLLNYSTAFNQAYTEHMQALVSQSAPDQIAQSSVDFIQQNFGTFMASKPELNIGSIRFTLPEGSFNSRMSVKLDDYNVTLPQMASSLFWRSNVVVDAYADADKQLATKLATMAAEDRLDSAGVSTAQKEQMVQQQADMMLGALTAGGILILNGDKFVSELAMKNGETLVNGKAIPLPY